MTPPHMTRMSGRPRALSSLMSSGTRVLCPAASVLTPTQCTSASTACCATSRGVCGQTGRGTGQGPARGWAQPRERGCKGNALPAAQSYLEQGANIHVKADVCEAGSDDFGPSVVAILAHLGNEDTRPAALMVQELVNSGWKHAFCQWKSQCNPTQKIPALYASVAKFQQIKRSSKSWFGCAICTQS